jgi:hypothetical protein
MVHGSICRWVSFIHPFNYPTREMSRFLQLSSAFGGILWQKSAEIYQYYWGKSPLQICQCHWDEISRQSVDTTVGLGR